MHFNSILLSDSYKLSHWVQYPPGTNKIYSYYESRGGLYDEVVFYGLKYVLKNLPKYVSSDDIEVAHSIAKRHFGNDKYFNREGWQYIADYYKDYLPLRIKSVPEGTVVPTGNVMMTVENTDPKCFWLTNFVETALCHVWYPITVATISREIKKTLKRALKQTSDLEGHDFERTLSHMLHDFGMRGATGMEAAAIGGSAHLINFNGSDTLVANEFISTHYETSDRIYADSIAASEHSTMTSWGREHESDAYANMLKQYDGPVSVVSDSYDIFHAVKNLWGLVLQDDVKNHKGTVIIRPDSGDPVAVTLGVLSELALAFGDTTNSKGYRVLPSNVRVLWGDGLDHKKIKRMVKCLKKMNWSLENVAFGMGSGMLQKVDRDIQRLAFKCSYAEINSEGRDVYKTSRNKESKRGRMKLVIDHKGKFETVPESDSRSDQMIDQYLPGVGPTQQPIFDEIRQRAKI